MTARTDAPATTPARSPSQTRIAVRSVERSLAASARATGRRVRDGVARLARVSAPVTGVVSRDGWLVLVAAGVSLGL
jgi:hypothetical protein